MAVIVFAVLFLGSLAAMILRTRQDRDRTYLAPAWLGWLGSLLVCGSLLILPWATVAPTGTFQRNAEWLTQNTDLLDKLREVPALQPLLASIQLGSVDAIRQTLSSPETQEFLTLVEQGDTLSAWALLRLAWPVSPLLSLAIVMNLLAAIISLAASLLTLSSAPNSGRILGMASGVLAVAGLTALVVRIPIIDTIGNTDNFLIRIIAVMGGVQVASGGWWMVLGCVLLTGTAAWYTLLGRPTAADDSINSYWNQYTT